MCVTVLNRSLGTLAEPRALDTITVNCVKQFKFKHLCSERRRWKISPCRGTSVNVRWLLNSPQRKVTDLWGVAQLVCWILLELFLKFKGASQKLAAAHVAAAASSSTLSALCLSRPRELLLSLHVRRVSSTTSATQSWEVMKHRVPGMWWNIHICLSLLHSDAEMQKIQKVVCRCWTREQYCLDFIYCE